MQSTKVVGTIIGLVLALYVAAGLMPNAITAAVNATNSSTPAYTLWNSSVLSLWNLMPLFIIIGIILLLYKFVKMD